MVDVAEAPAAAAAAVSPSSVSIPPALISASNNAPIGRAAVTPAPKERGRKTKADSGRSEIRWSNEMVETLMKARFEEFYTIFRDAKHSRKISEAWRIYCIPENSNEFDNFIKI